MCVREQGSVDGDGMGAHEDSECLEICLTTNIFKDTDFVSFSSIEP